METFIAGEIGKVVTQKKTHETHIKWGFIWVLRYKLFFKVS
jgi:hypothetical protein